ncbi:MAG: ceramidase domain-containing protein [Verrucomicrobiota bacterium]
MPPPVQKSPLIIWVPILTALLSMVLFWLAVVNGWLGASDPGVGEFCECQHPGLIKEPSNTWSNLGFIFSGLSIARLLRRGTYDGNSNGLTRSLFYPVFYSSLVVFLGPGSMAKHATNAPLGGFCDMLSMYLLASFTVAYAAERFFRLKPLQFTWIFSLVLTSCIIANFTHCSIIFGFFGNTAFAFYMLLTVVLEVLNIYVRKVQHETRWAFFSVGTLLLSFVIWNISKTGAPLCYPDSLIQGHAIWHLLDALAAFFLFRYYVSEHSELKPEAD